jgi:cytochrome o ubiquinol oxidase subunit II
VEHDDPERFSGRVRLSPRCTRRMRWALLAASSLPLGLLAGCEHSVLSPAGPVGFADRIVMLDSTAIMLAIIIPTMLATLLFAWWFRASNTRAHYLPSWDYSGSLELIIWSIPLLVIIFLGGVAWIGAHQLDPAQPLSAAEPLELQVVSLDWKWLFIYPRQGVASVNHLVVPAGRPLRFRITSATVFNVFFVPELGSEIYAMYGMETPLNLQADHVGDFFGLSAMFSGDGFSDMSFDLQAVAPTQFSTWVAETRARGTVLDDTSYRALLQQTQNVKPYTYRAVQTGLFDQIVEQRLPAGFGPPSGVVAPLTVPTEGP